MHQVFISYTTHDSRTALAVAVALRRVGYSTWAFQTDGVAGPTHLKQVGDAIDGANTIVAFLSQAALDSIQVRSEIFCAHDIGKSIIPLLLGITHSAVQQDTAWRQALATSSSESIDSMSDDEIAGTIVAGLEGLGVHPGSTTPPNPGLQPAVPVDELPEIDRRAAPRTWRFVTAGVLLLILFVTQALLPDDAGSLAPELRPSERLDWALVRPGTAIDESVGLEVEVIDKDTGIEFALILPGQYMRGASDRDASAPGDEKPAHMVEISHPFYLAKKETTNEQYARLDPDHAPEPLRGLPLDGAAQPVVRVAWQEAQAFCDKFGMRLPTEAEWEYACRAGNLGIYPWGDDLQDGEGRGNLYDQVAKNRLGYPWPGCPWRDEHLVTAPVGSYEPNAWGLFDMTGNVVEWCADYYKEGAYQESAGVEVVVDPRIEMFAPMRVIRGCSWNGRSEDARASKRGHEAEGQRAPHLGFRVARDPDS